MKILPNIGKAAFMFMSNKDLPPYGRALDWAIAAGAWVCVLYAICWLLFE